jgi:hypothetical protein
MEGDSAHRAKGIAATFFAQASKGETVVITARLSAVITIANRQSMRADGWEVFITGRDGIRYRPAEFDRLLTLRSAARLEI